MVFCLAHYLALNQTRIGEFKRGFLYPLLIVGAFGALILKEPDFGTAALSIVVGIALVFLAGAKWRYILPTIAAVGLLFAAAVMLNPNRLHRFTAFLNVERNKQAGTYQLYQSMAAFAAGGTDGAGLGQGRQQLGYTPEAHNDFIFSVVGEELGLPFTIGVVAIFAIIFIAGLVHLRRAPNLFHFLLVAGCLLLICLQAIVNIGVVTGVFPTKGMSLPFISAGLSNLLLMGLLLGVLLNTQRTWGRAALPGPVADDAGGAGMSRLLISCGGTGGHLSPGISLAEGLRARGHEVVLLISEKKVDARLAEKYPELRFERMPGTGFSWQPIPFVRCLVSQGRAFLFCLRLIRRMSPDAIVGFGGFTSAPAVLAGRWRRVPVALHECNRVPGRAIRTLGRIWRRGSTCRLGSGCVGSAPPPPATSGCRCGGRSRACPRPRPGRSWASRPTRRCSPSWAAARGPRS